MSNFWLIKSEPTTYSYSDLKRDGKTRWDGVRNFQARNFLRQMKPGDKALYYHSGDDKAVVGVAEVSKAAYADPTAQEGDWSAVDVIADKEFSNPVTLAQIKSHDGLQNLMLIRQSRLSVMPVTASEFKTIVKLSGEK